MGVVLPRRHSAYSRTPTRHSRMEAGGTAPLTFEEFVNLNPALIPPPPVLERLMAYRSMVEPALPQITATVAAAAERLARKGFNVPARFLPSTGPSDAEVLDLVESLYRKYLATRY